MPLNIVEGPSNKMSGRGRPKRLTAIESDLEDESSGDEERPTEHFDKLPINLKTTLPEKTPRDIWCCCCGNGGTLLSCAYCPRVVCYNHCVKLQAPADLVAKDTSFFLCPGCHGRWDRTNKSRKPTPYIGLVVKGKMWTGGPARVASTPIRGRFRAISTPNLAIINIRLEGLADGGDPAFLTYQFLRAYYPPNSPTVLEYFHVHLNIDPDKAASQRSHERRMSDIKNKLQKAGIEHVLVFVFTHSDPENGFLHCQEQFKSEISVADFFSIALGEPLEEYLRGCKADLFLLTCAGVFNNQESLAQLLDFARRDVFRNIISFSQLFFYPHIVSSFIQKFTMKVHVESYSVDRIAPALLEEEVNMGCNTDVSFMTAKRFYSYRLSSWKHGRPLGIRIMPQCGECAALLCLRYSPVDTFTVRVRCKSCKLEQILVTEDDVYLPAAAVGSRATCWVLCVRDGTVAAGQGVPDYVNRRDTEMGLASQIPGAALSAGAMDVDEDVDEDADAEGELDGDEVGGWQTVQALPPPVDAVDQDDGEDQLESSEEEVKVRGRVKGRGKGKSKSKSKGKGSGGKKGDGVKGKKDEKPEEGKGKKEEKRKEGKAMEGKMAKGTEAVTEMREGAETETAKVATPNQQGMVKRKQKKKALGQGAGTEVEVEVGKDLVGGGEEKEPERQERGESSNAAGGMGEGSDMSMSSSELSDPSSSDSSQEEKAAGSKTGPPKRKRQDSSELPSA